MSPICAEPTINCMLRKTKQTAYSKPEESNSAYVTSRHVTSPFNTELTSPTFPKFIKQCLSL